MRRLFALFFECFFCSRSALWICSVYAILVAHSCSYDICLSVCLLVWLVAVCLEFDFLQFVFFLIFCSQRFFRSMCVGIFMLRLFIYYIYYIIDNVCSFYLGVLRVAIRFATLFEYLSFFGLTCFFGIHVYQYLILNLLENI